VESQNAGRAVIHYPQTARRDKDIRKGFLFTASMLRFWLFAVADKHVKTPKQTMNFQDFLMSKETISFVKGISNSKAVLRRI